jgi:hypothetical protein
VQRRSTAALSANEREHEQTEQTRHTDEAYPLIPVIVMPWIKLFCAKKMSEIIGSTIVVEAAISILCE